MRENNPLFLMIYVIAGVVISASAVTYWSALGVIMANLIISALFFRVNVAVFRKIIYIIPFGGFIAFLQPFIRGENIIFSYWIFNIRAEGLEFGLLLFSRLFSAFTFISLIAVLEEHEIIGALRQLRIPREFIFLLSLTIRYLMEFRLTLRRMKECASSRGFELSSIPYGRKLRIISYLMGSLIINAMVQADRSYEAMISRGFSAESGLFVKKSEINPGQIFKLSVLIIFVAISGIIPLAIM